MEEESRSKEGPLAKLAAWANRKVLKREEKEKL